MSYISNAEEQRNIHLNVLTEAECEKIVETAFRILEECGWTIGDDPHMIARDAMRELGCRVEGDTVYYPRSVVKKALDSFPKEFVLYDQLGNEAIRISGHGNKTYMTNAVMAPFFMDLETGERRPTCSRDAYNAALICDALPNIDYVAGMIWYKGVKHEQLSGVYDGRQLIEATTKPIWLWMADIDSDKYIQEMCAAVKGSWKAFVEKPFCWLATYIQEGERSAALFKTGAPVGVGGVVNPGVTTTVYLAGSIATALAETFASIVLQQAFSPAGTSAICQIVVNIPNFKTAEWTCASPELTLAGAAVTDVFRYLDLPNMYHYGWTDSPVLDAQAASDYMANLMFGKLSGCGMAYFNGFLEAANTVSLESVVLANEIANYLNHLVEGIKVDDETLAFDLIKEIGPNGMYMSDESTAEHFMDFWQPTLFTHENWDQFVAGGSKDFKMRANEWCRKVVADGPRVPRSPELLAKLDEIVAEAEQDFEKKHGL